MAEASDLKSLQYGFDSHRRYSGDLSDEGEKITGNNLHGRSGAMTDPMRVGKILELTGTTTFILEKHMKECPHKGENQYSAEHDAAYCPICDIWLEQKCSDPECSYCKDRPEKPSSIKEQKGE